MNPTLKKLLPHLAAYFVLLILAFARFAPVVFEGKALQQGDNLQARGMQAESRKIEEKTGEFPLWTNACFAGMPAYQILYPTKNLMQYVNRTFLLGNHMAPPHTGILLLAAGFYLLLVVLGVDWRIALVGAAGFGLAGNHMHLAEAGHSTKIIASAYVAPALAGILLTFRGKYWLGGGLTALFFALNLYANHLQITYYFLLTMLIFGIVYLVDAIRKGALPGFLKATGITAAAVALAFATNAGRLMTTEEYSQETIRGKSELTQKSSNASGSKAGETGLSKEYAFGWSYGVLETYNLLIPNFVGGSSNTSLAGDENSATRSSLMNVNQTELAKWATENGVSATNPNDQIQALAQETTPYWGSQPFTGGGVYIGAVFALLFFLGAFLVKSPLKWYLIASSVLCVFLAWGKHFAAFNFFLFDTLPMMNKFRAVTMALGLTNLFVVVLGILGLQAFFNKNIEAAERKRALLMAGGITGGLVLLGYLMSFVVDFQKEGENFPASVAAAVAEDRAALLRADALRTLLFFAAAFSLLWFWLRGRFAAVWAVLGIGLVSLVDNWAIGNRFLDEGDYVNSTDMLRFIAPTPADEQILKDTDPHYRVADFRRGSPTSNALTSYHHKSIGGYHAAKLMRFQELVERHFQKDGRLRQPMEASKVYGMLNTKYFIYSEEQALPNPDACGNAWFVREVQIVENGDAEINALEGMNPKEKAVLQKSHAAGLEGFTPQFDSTATIRLTHYHPDTLIYQYSAASDQLALFSEIYYPPSKGWSMYLDGQKAPDFIKANFLLRAAKLPAGQHEVKMVFSPASYHTGEMISLLTSLLALGLAVWGIVWFSKKYDFPAAASLPEAEEKKPVRKTKPVEVKKKR